MLTVENLNQYYGQSHTLWDINLHIEKGSCTCILGRNGVGKTTLMQSLMGLAPNCSGSIKIDGVDISKTRTEQRASLGFAYVPQGRQIFPQLNVEENIRTGFYASRAKHKYVPDEIYELFPVLKEMRLRRAGDLSGGQQQQLAIARALVLSPEILILDEPTEGIQPTIIQQIGDVIMQLNQEKNITILLVEQKLPFARRVGTHFIILDSGRLMADAQMPALSDDIVNQYLTV